MRVWHTAFILAACAYEIQAATLNPSSSCFGIVEEVTENPSGVQQAEISANYALQMLPVWLSFECKQSLRNFICVGTFKDVTPLDANQEFTICSNVCDQTNTLCGDFFAQLPPDSGLELLFSGLQQCQDVSGCFAGNYTVLYEEDYPECPRPLLVPDRNDPTTPVAGTGCALPCLSFYYTDEEWDNFFAIFDFFSYFGFAAGLYMIAISLNDMLQADDEHKTGSIFVLLFILGSSLAAVGAVLLVSMGTREHLCAGNTTTSDTNDAVCLIQGYLYLIGTLMAAGSSCCQCVDLYLRVVQRTGRANLRRYRLRAFAFLFIFIAYPVVIVAATNHIGYEMELNIPSCHIITTRQPWVQYVAWYGPVTFASTVCVVCMAHTVFKINKVLNATWEGAPGRSSSGSQTRGVQKFVRYNIRPILFIILVGFVGLYPCLLRYYYEALAPEMEDSTEEFFECLLEEGMNDASAAEQNCGAVPDVRPAYETMATSTAIICAYGMLPLLVYGIKYPECGVLRRWFGTSQKMTVAFTSAKKSTPSDVGRYSRSNGSAAPAIELMPTQGVQASPKRSSSSVDDDTSDKDITFAGTLPVGVNPDVV